MLLFAMVMAAAVATPAVAAPDAARAIKPFAGGKCPRTAGYYAWQRGKQVKPHKLTELPSANAYYTVYRLVGGCEVPVVVRYGVGNR
jgi:hypothetical protein